MRHKRAKAYKKLMSLYHMSFGFREPYQVLVDSEMCSLSTSLKLDLIRQFAIVLQGDVKPMITQCSIVELYKLGSPGQQAADLAKTFERRKCNHRDAIPGDECITSVVGNSNKHRYVIACQSQEMRTRLHGVPGVPILHLNRTVMVLEPPSDATMQAKQRAEETALLPSAPERRQIATDGSVQPLKKQKKQGPKAPNPLSVKKKKVRIDETKTTAQTKVGEKRKREDEHTSHNRSDTPAESKRKRKRRNKVQVSHTDAPD